MTRVSRNSISDVLESHVNFMLLCKLFRYKINLCNSSCPCEQTFQKYNIYQTFSN